MVLAEEFKKDIDFEILKGDVNPIRNYVITLGQSSVSKGVMFVMYSYLKECKSAHVNPANYLGNLGADMEIAVANARKRVPKFAIQIEDWETVSKRLTNNTMPFGKYKGSSIEDIFDKDEKYLLWIANSDSFQYIKAVGCRSLISEYSKIAKENITQTNRGNSLSKALLIEDKTNVKELTVYSIYTGQSEWGDPYRVVKLTDADGNKYKYNGSSNKITDETKDISLKCRISGNYESMGIIFNNLKLRNSSTK
jgi:uncharacterized protein (DUF3820 family)